MQALNPLNKEPALSNASMQGGFLSQVLREDTPQEAIDLIKRLLEYEPHKRITARQALDHPFFDELKPSKLDDKSSLQKRP